VIYQSRGTQYREMQVLSATPARRTVMLFEHLEVLLRRALLAMQHEQVEARVEALQKSRAIVAELLGTLDLERGGDLAVELSMHHSFLLAELADVGIRRDVVRLGRLIGIVHTLSTAFSEAAAQLERAGRSEAHAVPA
jgi:flagellar secretion chaperone FliS